MLLQKMIPTSEYNGFSAHSSGSLRFCTLLFSTLVSSPISQVITLYNHLTQEPPDFTTDALQVK